MKEYYIYILSNINRTVFYAGVTNDLIRRVYEHKNKLVEGFTSRYNIDCLLYYEIAYDPGVAIAREKQIKKISRKKKMDLILSINPSIEDLYDELTAA